MVGRGGKVGLGMVTGKMESGSGFLDAHVEFPKLSCFRRLFQVTNRQNPRFSKFEGTVPQVKGIGFCIKSRCLLFLECQVGDHAKDLQCISLTNMFGGNSQATHHNSQFCFPLHFNVIFRMNMNQ